MTTGLIFEKKGPAAAPRLLPQAESIHGLLPRDALRTTPPGLPDVGESEVVRHYTRLSRRTFGVDLNFYPLGSCTMKYNPKVNEKAASLPGFAALHPYQCEKSVQGILALLYALQEYLAEIAGMDAVSLQPAAGAHGELTSLKVIKAYHQSRGRDRTRVLIPDSAHGTNPASSALCGFRTVQVPSDAEGGLDLAALEREAGDDTAALMITNPSTLGLFERHVVRVAEIIHAAGGLVYMDGANMNALLGIARPGDCGMDIMHYNCHKTFSTPHGGGGPGAGPIAVKLPLARFLPAPIVARRSARNEAGHHDYFLDYDRPDSIGKVRCFHGNVGVLIKTYAYIRQLGAVGLRRVAEHAILNANYLRVRLHDAYHVPHDRTCMHEFVLSAGPQAKNGVRALDIAKRLIDHGFHPPTIYFPLIVREAMMIEPTETESRETLDAFAGAMIAIAREAEKDPDAVRSAPRRPPDKTAAFATRVDEVKAARELVLRWEKERE